MAYLVEQTDSAGRKYLATSADGGRLITDQDCGKCCGGEPCSRVYAYLACCATAPVPFVYVCADAKCNGTPIADVLRIVVGTMCYSRSASSSSVPVLSSMTLTDGADIAACDHGGCASAECVDYCGNRFVPGMLCPGQNYGGPPVFVPAIEGITCGILGIGSPRVCFKFDPSNTVPESHVPAGAIIADLEGLKPENNPTTDCCACVPGCSQTVQTVTECSGAGPVNVERTCCCTNRRDVTINFTSTTTYNPAISFTLTRVIVGSALVQYDDSGIAYNVVGGTATVTETNQIGPPSVYNYSFTSFTPQGRCLPLPIDPFGPFKPFPWVTDCTFTDNDGANTSQTLTNIVRTCANGLLSGTWSLRRNAGIPGDPLSGQVLAEGTYTSTIAVQFFGLCSGGCGGTAGRAGVIVARGTAGCASCGDNATGGATI